MQWIRMLGVSAVCFAALGLSAAFAWGWGLPIKPGDQVIDIARLNGSAEVTAKAVATALQTLQLYENKKTSLLPTATQGEVTAAVQAARNLLNQITPAGPLGQSAGTAWSAFAAATDKNLSARATAAQNTAMRTVAENANFDAVAVIRAQSSNSRQTGAEIQRLAGISEDGILGQRQTGVSQRALLLQMMMDDVQEEAATDIAAATNIERELAIGKIAIRQQRDLLLKTYDLYNRTGQDDSYHPAAAGIGWPRFTE
ncbi:MAG: hypothetical protein P4N59_03850 [Negativicutes bacterium]|nr:hypothetical protein [Negativicutes bacterium]